MPALDPYMIKLYNFTELGSSKKATLVGPLKKKSTQKNVFDFSIHEDDYISESDDDDSERMEMTDAIYKYPEVPQNEEENDEPLYEYDKFYKKCYLGNDLFQDDVERKCKEEEDINKEI